MKSQRYIEAGREWLLKLADHLKNGQLGHEQFCFSVFNACGDPKHPHWDRKVFKHNGCGTLGCALGEMPIICDEWIFENLDPVPIQYRFASTMQAAELFFGLNSEESYRLFIPGKYSPWSEKILYHNATKEQVADSILAFVAYKDAQ